MPGPWTRPSWFSARGWRLMDLGAPVADDDAVRKIDLAPAFAAAVPVGFGGMFVGQYYDNNPHANSVNLAAVAGQLDLAPFVAARDFTIDRIGLAVSTGVASAHARALVYSAGTDGWPDALLADSGSLDASAAAYVFGASTLAFTKGTVYWVGSHSDSTATLRCCNTSCCWQLGLSTSSSANYFSILRRSVTYGSAPTSWGATTAADLGAAAAPSVRWRVASLP